ncbi:hypothetical protein [Pseudoalteromonas sp. BDTF-M6]|uniref:hypothetical protein n=1 Tax=Pseudoalteromonas sp. BDTF-M6 TaxID=2796132 RepID=UPI001BB03B70|nr:hypothetical protein [Pseudoalteromonas sp. BDTF-M6]MBS3797993.1 hypothetical protein [Pseudoalteromonas sp. BDTF-M6]
MEKKVIQLSIAELMLHKRGPMDGAEDINLFRFVLSYPAEGISAIESVKTLLSTDELPTDWDSDFDKAILFKTPLRGKAQLSIEACSVDKDSQAQASFKKLLNSILGSTLGIFTGGFGSAYVGKITNTVGKSVIDVIGDEEDVDIIGKATYLLDSEQLPETIDLPLVVDTPVVEKKYVLVGHENSVNRRRKVVENEVIPAGNNGQIRIKVTEL